MENGDLWNSQYETEQGISQVDPIDLDVEGLTKDYTEGGPEIVSGARVRANPHLLLPGSLTPAFPYNNQAKP